MRITNKDYYEDWLRIKKDLDLIIQGLKVEERCDHQRYLQDTDVTFATASPHDCPDCKGSGTITRPPTAEEVREFLTYIFSRHDEPRYYLCEGVYIYDLQSGAEMMGKK